MPSLALAPSLEDEVPPETAAFFRRALRVLVDAEVPFLVGGAFAHACFTGIRRATKDLDLFVRREDYDRVAALMEAEGWRAELTYPHWLAKVYAGDDFIDLIFNSGNGISPVDDSWFRDNARPVLGVPVASPTWRTVWCPRPSSWSVSATTAPTSPICCRPMPNSWTGPAAGTVRCALAGVARAPHSLRLHLSRRAAPRAAVVDGDAAGRLTAELRQPPAVDVHVCAGTLLSRSQYLHDVEQLGFWTAASPRPAP